MNKRELSNEEDQRILSLLSKSIEDCEKCFEFINQADIEDVHGFIADYDTWAEECEDKINKVIGSEVIRLVRSKSITSPMCIVEELVEILQTAVEDLDALHEKSQTP